MSQRSIPSQQELYASLSSTLRTVRPDDDEAVVGVSKGKGLQQTVDFTPERRC